MTDLDGRCFVRKGNALYPADFAADELLASIPEGKEVIITTRRPRNPAFHRWFFAKLRKVVENTERWVDEEDLLWDLKVRVGHVRRRIDGLTGREIIEPKSINFAAMGEDQFRRFSNRCDDVLAPVLGVDPNVLMDEVKHTQSHRRVA
jgi:hypothetical protein